MAEAGKSDTRSSVGQLVQTAGASVALIVALTTAGYTLYQKLVIDPEEEKNQKSKAFSDALGRFATTAQTMQTQLSFATNDQARSAIQGNYSYPLNQALGDAEKAANSKGFKTSPLEYNQLAADEQSMGKFDQVVVFAKKSISSGALNYDAASAHDMLAKAAVSMRGRDGLNESRSEMVLSLNSLASTKVFGTNQARAGFTGDWAYIEAIWGDCAKYSELLDKMTTITSQTDVPPGYKAAFTAGPGMMQAAQKCSPGKARVDRINVSDSTNGRTQVRTILPSESESDGINANGSDTKAVLVQAMLDPTTDYEQVTVYIDGIEQGHIHVGKASFFSTATVPVRLGASYRLEGYISVTENSQRVHRDVKGGGHFHGRVFPVYHLQNGTRTDGVQTVFLSRGPVTQH